MRGLAMNGFIEKFYESDDGLRLYGRDYQPTTDVAGRLPVICLPGLTRNSRDFHELALLLSQDAISPRRVIALDYRGRGMSERDSNKANYNLAVECGDVIAACAAFGIDRAIFIGTSRGGLILHLLASAQPRLPSAMVFNDIGPVIEPAGLMAIRDYLNRDRKPGTWPEATAILKENHGGAFPLLNTADWQAMARAIYRDDKGVPVPDCDPAIAEQLKTVNFENPLPDLWSQFDVLGQIPLLVIRGENSNILSPRTVDAMARRHTGMAQFTAEGQGHAPLLHLQDIPARIQAFMDELG